MANNMLLQRAVLFDLRSGPCKLSLYSLTHSSSRVRETIVRIEPAASQAIWTDSSWAFLFAWSLSTTTCYTQFTRSASYMEPPCMTHETNETCRDKKGGAGDSDKSDFPDEGKTKG